MFCTPPPRCLCTSGKRAIKKMRARKANRATILMHSHQQQQQQMVCLMVDDVDVVFVIGGRDLWLKIIWAQLMGLFGVIWDVDRRNALSLSNRVVFLRSTESCKSEIFLMCLLSRIFSTLNHFEYSRNMFTGVIWAQWFYAEIQLRFG